MHDSFTPMGGLVPLVEHHVGRSYFWWRGLRALRDVVFVVLTVFIAGLMVGRTPEYLGKKIEAYDVKMSMLLCSFFAFSILGFAHGPL